ncbi:MAG: sigma 54-interacting transcriptional regulator, partial [Candidatus Methylumidiphilus sp.]
ASVLGQPWRRVFPIDVDSARQFQRTLEAKTKLREPLSIHWQDADQGTHWVECVVKDDPRDSARRLVFLDDVTELRSLRNKLEAKRYGGLVGDSEAMENLNRMIVQIGRGDWTVLIEGETGVGKELVARGIHEASPRKAGPYVAINAAGLSESLLSSQLFGHRKGAFTGATADQQGFFEAANGGTLFLDEIGDLPLAMQAALLRVLQEREIIRLGETQARKSDVRIIAATHKDLIAEVAAGRFREDLFFRLRVARIHIPSLRERKTDIPLLVEHFLRSASQQIGKPVNSLQADALQRLLAYDWPGNVRELRSCVDFALIHCLGDSIQVNDLPPEIRNQRLGDLPNTGLGLALIDDERQRILQALKTAGGNRTKAVQLLGISRATFYRRLQELGIEI